MSLIIVLIMEMTSWSEIVQAADRWIDNNSLWSGLLFALLGSILGAIFNVRSYAAKVFNKFEANYKLTDKSQHTLSQVATDSPGANQETAEGDIVHGEISSSEISIMENSPGGFQQRADQIIGTQNNFYNEPQLGDPQELLNSPPSTSTENTVLTPNQLHIAQKVSTALQRLGLSIVFQQRYQSAVHNLHNGNAQICASEYHSSFLNIVPVLLDRTTYSGSAPSEDDQNRLRDCFEALKNFMTSSSRDEAQLRGILSNFENSLMTVLGYL